MDYEIDWDAVAFDSCRHRMAIERLEQLHEPIERNIRSICESIESWANVSDYPFDFDFEDEREQIEDLLGIAFVAAQTHLTIVRKSMVQLSKSLAKSRGRGISFVTDDEAFNLFCLTDDEAFDDPPKFKSKSDCPINIVNAVANYWKHHEEWPEKNESVQLEGGHEVPGKSWDIDKAKKSKNKRVTAMTMETVIAIGMRPGEPNMQCAALALGISNSRLWDLSPFRKILKDWGECLLRHV